MSLCLILVENAGGIPVNWICAGHETSDERGACEVMSNWQRITSITSSYAQILILIPWNKSTKAKKQSSHLFHPSP